MAKTNRLREIRESLGVTQDDLWQATGVGLATLSRIENDHVVPRSLTRKKIAHALGVPMKMIWPVRPPR